MPLVDVTVEPVSTNTQSRGYGAIVSSIAGVEAKVVTRHESNSHSLYVAFASPAKNPNCWFPWLSSWFGVSPPFCTSQLKWLLKVENSFCKPMNPRRCDFRDLWYWTIDFASSLSFHWLYIGFALLHLLPATPFPVLKTAKVSRSLCRIHVLLASGSRCLEMAVLAIRSCISTFA